MNSEEATVAVVDVLEALDVPYMLVGSFSSNFYGIPRATEDADFVLQLERQSVSEIARRLGPQFRLDAQMSFEMVTGTTRYVLQLADTSFRIEFFLLSEDAHDQERFNRRRRVRILDRETFVPTVEDVIITKLRWSRQGQRTKDIEDVRGVVAVNGDRVQWDYVNGWCDRHDTRATLEEIRRSVPPSSTV